MRCGLGGMIAGTPESGGWSSRELRRIVQSMKGLNIVGMDIVEVARESDLYLTPVTRAVRVVLIVLLGFPAAYDTNGKPG